MVRVWVTTPFHFCKMYEVVHVFSVFIIAYLCGLKSVPYFPIEFSQVVAESELANTAFTIGLATLVIHARAWTSSLQVAYVGLAAVAVFRGNKIGFCLIIPGIVFNGSVSLYLLAIVVSLARVLYKVKQIVLLEVGQDAKWTEILDSGTVLNSEIKAISRSIMSGGAAKSEFTLKVFKIAAMMEWIVIALAVFSINF